MRIFGRQSTRDLRTSRGCGCDDNHACIGGCSWVLLDIDAPTGVTPETNLIRVAEMNRAIERHWREVLKERAP